MKERNQSYFALGWKYAEVNPGADPWESAERLFKKKEIPEWAKELWIDGFMACLTKQAHERNKLDNPRSKK